ncbi:MAG TPA: alpha/beta hydrolase [Chitinophagaceae bacterium]|nr:alpha/beta hydrolase [Chitinophagaceae bacterium]
MNYTTLSCALKCTLFLLLFSGRTSAQKPVSTKETIQIGGIKQYIRIKGQDDSNPLLLFLHGGPGGSLMNKADHITGKLQQRFVVVHWDQRETGETLRLNKSPEPLTLELFYNDTRELIDSLLKRFNRPRLYLVGYSWGSGLGFHIAGKYPELLYAYIAISPVINQWSSDSISLAMLRETMGKKAAKELSTVKIPFENADQLYYHRKWLLKHEGKKLVDITFPKSIVDAWASVWFTVWLQACDVNLFESLPAINCPVYFLAGEKDYNTNFNITREYYKKVTAPKKNIFLFEDIGHGVPETDPDLYQDIIIEKILPQTFTAPVEKRSN